MEESNRNENDYMTKMKPANPLKRGFEWRPVSTINSTVLCFLISGIIFVIIGILIMHLSNQVTEFVVRYDNLSNCDLSINNSLSKDCSIELNIENKLEPPVMVYYQLENFYQDHRRYIKSRSTSQLKGEVLEVSQIADDCYPVVRVSDLYTNKTIGNYTLDPDAPANPCGLIAKSLFNDTFQLYSEEKRIPISERNIAWKTDYDKYQQPKDASMLQWTNVTDEHFMVWMRPAGLPDFRKLWGRIEDKILPGIYRLDISNNFYVKSFSGKKYFVLSTVNALGGKNYFLGIAYLAVGSVCLLIAGIFWIGYKNFNRRKLE